MADPDFFLGAGARECLTRREGTKCSHREGRACVCHLRDPHPFHVCGDGCGEQWRNDAYKLARKTDPVSSHDAAKASESFASTHEGKILDAMTRYGRSATHHDIARASGLQPVQVARRLKDMIDRNLIAEVDGWEEVPRCGQRLKLYRLVA